TGQRFAERALHTADVGDDAALAERGRRAAQQLRHGAERRREDDEVGARDQALDLGARFVDDAGALGRGRARGMARDAAPAARDAPRACACGHRAPEEAEAPHRHALEGGSAHAFPRTRRSAATSRSFSSLVPIVTRTWSGMPKPASGRTIT